MLLVHEEAQKHDLNPIPHTPPFRTFDIAARIAFPMATVARDVPMTLRGRSRVAHGEDESSVEQNSSSEHREKVPEREEPLGTVVPYGAV